MLLGICWLATAAFAPTSSVSPIVSKVPRARQALPQATATATAPVFMQTSTNTELKMRIMTLAASLDRGQSFNPTSSEAYAERMGIMTALLRELIAASPPLPADLAALDGEWELVFTNVAHGIFRSSPFFLAIQEAYANAGAPEKESVNGFRISDPPLTLPRMTPWSGDESRAQAGRAVLQAPRAADVLVGCLQDRPRGANHRRIHGATLL